MISRLAIRGALQRNLRMSLVGIRKSSTSSVAVANKSNVPEQYRPEVIGPHDEMIALLKSDDKETVVLGHKIEDIDKADIDVMNCPAPPGYAIKVVAHNTMDEIKQNDKPLEDEMCVWFGKNMPTIEDDKNPERDLVNFPRPVVPVDPPEVRLAFLPGSWFRFLYDKTGVTGPYALALGTTVFLLSKEFYVIGHGTVSGLTMAFWIAVFMKTAGVKLSAYAERTLLSETRQNLKWQENTIKTLEEYIAGHKHNQESIKNQTLLFDAKRENIQLQREAEYRRRMMTVYEEAKRKLDYQLAIQDTVKQFSQRHMVNWIIDSVQKGIGAEQEKVALSQAISQLKSISAKRANVI